MGEASDPNFGKRGLVVSAPFEVQGTTLRVRSSNLDPQELRSSVLLWDRLVWPSSRAIHLASGPDESFWRVPQSSRGQSTRFTAM